MSGEDTVPKKPGDNAGADYAVPDQFTLQVAADDSCAIQFFSDGVSIGRFYLDATLAELLWRNLDPETRREKLEQARSDFLKGRH